MNNSLDKLYKKQQYFRYSIRKDILLQIIQHANQNAYHNPLCELMPSPIKNYINKVT